VVSGYHAVIDYHIPSAIRHIFVLTTVINNKNAQKTVRHILNGRHPSTKYWSIQNEKGHYADGRFDDEERGRCLCQQNLRQAADQRELPDATMPPWEWPNVRDAVTTEGAISEAGARPVDASLGRALTVGYLRRQCRTGRGPICVKRSSRKTMSADPRWIGGRTSAWKTKKAAQGECAASN
jgi:hypothetical protein